MSYFREIAFREDVPVIHASRKDRVVVIATRIPLKDMLPERWGWILTLGGKGEIVVFNDIEALSDNIGRRYPKVYLHADMLEYIQKWECVHWSAGYSDEKSVSTQDDSLPVIKQFKDELLHEINNEYQIIREDLNENLQSLIEQKMEEATKQAQTSFLEELTHQSVQEQSMLLERIEQQSHLSEHNLNDRIQKSGQNQLDKLNALLDAINDTKKDIDEIKDMLAPVNLEEEIISVNLEEPLKKLPAGPKTLPERFITSVITTNTRYHNTFDKEFKASFKLTYWIICVGIGLFALTVISLLVTFFFHVSDIALITNGVGAVLAAIVTTVGGLNKVHDNAATRQLKALNDLSNYVKFTHAQFMIEQVQDEAWQKTQLEKLINQYASIEQNHKK